MAVYLVPVSGGRTIVIDKAVVFVGRHPDCDVVITHSRKVSRKHCCICQVNESFVIRDLGSMNGVRVNGKRVKKENRINFGDEVSIGDVPFRLQKAKAAAPARQPAAPAPRASEKSAPRQSERPAPPRRPIELSQEFPVAIPDDGESFAVYGRHPDDASMGTLGQPDEEDDVPEAVVLDDDSSSGSEIEAS